MPRDSQRSKPHYPSSFAWGWLPRYCSSILHWYLPQGKPLWTLASIWTLQNCTQTPRLKADATTLCNGTRSIPLDIILGSWLQVALLDQEGWTEWPPEIPADLSYSVIMWLCDVPCTNGVKHHQGSQHFLLHWKGHGWEGVLGVCGDVSRSPTESTHTDGAIGGLWFPALRQCRLLPEPAVPFWIIFMASVVDQQSRVAI